MSELFRFAFRRYSRSFKYPMITHHGEWHIREGIILELTNEAGQVGMGEIAPISWFGSETLEAALEFCQQLPRKINRETIYQIPEHLVACRFGFESALEQITTPYSPQPVSLKYTALLPASKISLKVWRDLWENGYETFKWKMGVQSLEEEIEIFLRLANEIPPSIKLRLDANGGLTVEEAKIWLQVCEKIPQVEFLEQPLPQEKFEDMVKLSETASLPIALDESVATIPQLKATYGQGWRGIFVIKPAIMGFPSELRQFCLEKSLDLVFSSAFETEVGRVFLLKLAGELQSPGRAVGLSLHNQFA